MTHCVYIIVRRSADVILLSLQMQHPLQDALQTPPPSLPTQRHPLPEGRTVFGKQAIKDKSTFYLIASILALWRLAMAEKGH